MEHDSWSCVLLLSRKMLFRTVLYYQNTFNEAYTKVAFTLTFTILSKWFYFLLFLLWQAENGLRVVASPQRNQRCWRNGSCGRYVGEIRSPDYECLVGTGGWLMPVIRCTSLVLVLTEMSGYNVDKAKRGHWQHISNGVNSGFASLFQRKQTSGLVYKIDFV